MKRFIAATLIFMACGDLFAQQTTDKVDRFTGGREISYPGRSDTPLGQPRVMATATVKDGTTSAEVAILFAGVMDRRTGTSWKYLRCNKIAWLLDGEPMATEPATHHGNVVRGGVTELIIQPLTVDQLVLIGSADRVEYRICNEEHVLSREDSTGIAEVAAKAGIQ